MKLLTLICALILSASSAWATLGDTQDKLKSDNEQSVQSDHKSFPPTKDFPAQMDVFVFDYPNGTAYAAIVNGKVVSESWTRKDEEPVPKEFVISQMLKYSSDWEEIESALPGTVTFKSGDGNVFVVYGPNEDMKSSSVLTIYSRELLDVKNLIRI